MKLYSIRGGTKDELYSNKYNIGVGISLGSRWFTADNIMGLIEWSLQYSKEYVIVYVADSIHALNIEVRYKRAKHRPEKALKIAMGMGTKVIEEVYSLSCKKFSPEVFSKIHFARWDDILTTEFNRKVEFLNALYYGNADFRHQILEFVEEHLSQDDRVFSEEDKVLLGRYMVAELPELICRVPIKGLTFDCNVYPFDSKFLAFVEDIQQGKAYPNIAEAIFDTKPKVFLEVRD